MINIKSLAGSIFLYNAIAHGIFIFLYLIFNKDINRLICKKIFENKYILNLFYFIGHILIICAMVVRISIDERKIYSVAIIGSSGHFLLFLSVLFSGIFKLINIKLDTIIFLITQLGMIYVYNLEYIINNKLLVNYYSEFLIFIPLILGCGYYLHKFFKINSIFRYGNLAICLVYLFLGILTMIKVDKYKYCFNNKNIDYI